MSSPVAEAEAVKAATAKAAAESSAAQGHAAAAPGPSKKKSIKDFYKKNKNIIHTCLGVAAFGLAVLITRQVVVKLKNA